MSGEVRRKCNTCKSGFLSRCKVLKENPEYQAILEETGLDSWAARLAFKENFVCDNYRCKYIEFPIEVTGINRNIDRYSLDKHDIGKFVKIRPCAEECQGEIYLGLYLGDLPIDIRVSHNPESGELNLLFFDNPAIFVFDLNKIVYGMESWWGIIENEEDLKEITNQDIESIWYVKALKVLSKK